MTWGEYCELLGGLAVVIPAGILRVRWSKLTLADFLFVGFGLTYGAGILMTIDAPESAVASWVNGSVNYLELSLAVLLALYLAILCVFTWDLAFPAMARKTSLDSVQRQARAVPLIVLVLIAVGVLGLYLYGALGFGLINGLSLVGRNGVESMRERNIPYWYTAALQLVHFVSFSLVIFAGSRLRIRESRMFHRSLRLVFLCLLFVIVFIMGRRMMIYCAVGLIITSFSDVRGPRTIKVGVFLTIGIVAVAIGSNMYEFYRQRIGSVTTSQVLAHWSDFSLSNHNIYERPAEWSGTYLAIKGNSERGALHGKLMDAGIMNSIPYVLTHQKNYINVDRVISNSYNWPFRDLPDTPIMEMIIDWGLIGALPVGVLLFLFGVLIPGTAVVTFVRGNPLLQTFAAGGLAFALLDVEDSFYVFIIQFWKYLALLVVLGIFYKLLQMVSALNKRRSKFPLQRIVGVPECDGQ